ncbi:MAG: hypothetical protein IJX28_07095, partial [Clostridia bacterium]|nr:hypothetical protein [Clostridia bacterium]
CENSYVTGFSAFLTAGTHTIKMYVTEDMSSTFHFRNIYLLAQAPETNITFDDSNFSAELPAAFAGDNVIKVDMKAAEATVDKVVELKSTQYRLITYVDTGAVGMHGVCMFDPSGTGLYHYYLEPGANDFKDENGNGPTWYQAYIRWSVEIPEDGTYAVCFNFRLKNTAQRWSLLQVDNAQVKDMICMDYAITGDVNALKDSLENSYLTGLQLELTKGTHTLTFRLPDGQGSSWHYRNIYLVKVA